MASRNFLRSFHYPPVDRSLIQLGFYLTSIGSVHYPPNTPYPATGHPETYRFDWDKGRILHDYILILIGAGGGVFESAKIPLVPVNAGQIIYLIPGEWHRYRPHRSTGWSERWLCLNGFHLHQLRKSAIISDSSKILESGCSERVVTLLDRLLMDAKAEPTSNKASWSARALEILLKVFEETRPPRGAPLHALESDPLVNQALCYICESCHRPLTVDTVAASCHTARRTLERRFAVSGRLPIAQEIIRSRIERAKLLLDESQIPIKEIAFACGFVTPQRMIYSFRRHCGYTPGSLREGLR